MKKPLNILVTTFCLFNMLACSSNINTVVGSAGVYNYIKGKATIKEIKNAPNQPCADSVQVYFDFKPDNADEINNYKFKDFSDNNIEMYSNSQNPSPVWMARKGLKVGNTYEARRFEILKGTSTPYGAEILDKTVYPYNQQNADGSNEDICK